MIVNWGVHINGLSLAEGSSLFPDSVILGGFPDRTGVLVNGSQEEIAQQAKQILEEMNGRPFIIGSDCTLPTEISKDRIRQVVRSLEKQ